VLLKLSIDRSTEASEETWLRPFCFTSLYGGIVRLSIAAADLKLVLCYVCRWFVSWVGCVDASASTAHYNLRKGRSILIYVGGEEEQMLTTYGKHIVYLKGRKGFIKLALQYGAPLVPLVRCTHSTNESLLSSWFCSTLLERLMPTTLLASY
jgi:hypothetical protein